MELEEFISKVKNVIKLIATFLVLATVILITHATEQTKLLVDGSMRDSIVSMKDLVTLVGEIWMIGIFICFPFYKSLTYLLLSCATAICIFITGVMFMTNNAPSPVISFTNSHFQRDSGPNSQWTLSIAHDAGGWTQYESSSFTGTATQANEELIRLSKGKLIIMTTKELKH